MISNKRIISHINQNIFQNYKKFSTILKNDIISINYETKILKPEELEISFSKELKKLKYFIEVLLSKGGEKDIDILYLKKFFYLCHQTRDYVDKNIIESKEIQDKIIKIIHLNLNSEKNYDLTKYLLLHIETDVNSYLFKNLIINAIGNLKLKDKENETFHHLKDFRYNFLSIDPRLFIVSKTLMKILRSILHKLTNNKNYLIVESMDLVIISNILNDINVDITQEEFFFFVAKEVFRKELNLHFEMLYTIDSLEKKPDYVNNMFQYFIFYKNFKDNLNEKSLNVNSVNRIKQNEETKKFSLTFADKVEINKKFVEFFKGIFLKKIENFKNEKNKYKKSESNEEIFIKDKDNIYVLKAEDSHEVYVKKIVYFKYHEIVTIMDYFDDESLFDLAEYILTIKSRERFCSMDDILKLISIYLKKGKINSFILNFISVNAMEQLRIGMTRKQFEEKMTLIFGFICENCIIETKRMESIVEFFEEFKSVLFHGQFLDCNTDINESTAETTYFSNVSNEAFDTIRKFYSNISYKIYLDEPFLNYLNQYLNLSNCLNSLAL